MSKLHLKAHQRLLKEAKKYLKEVKSVEHARVEQKRGAEVLTQEHLFEWLQVFEEDRIKLDGCNQATVKR